MATITVTQHWEFGDWWKQVNDILEGDGYDIRFGDARYFYNLHYTPLSAATEHRAQVLEQRNACLMAGAVLDMWYGNHDWRDEGLPLEMDVGLANPAYIDHNIRVEASDCYRLRQPCHW